MKGIVTLILCVIVVLPLAGDELHLANGDYITGHIVSMDGESVTIETEYGRLTVDRSKVVSGSFTTGQTAASDAESFSIEFSGNLENWSNQDAAVVDHDTLRTAGVHGDDSTALQATGEGQFLEMSNMSEIDEAESLSVTFWVNVLDLSRLQYVLSKWESATGNAAVGKFAIGTRFGSLFIYLVDQEGVYHFQSFEDIVPAAQWVHLAIVFEEGLLSVYKNGEPAGSAELPFDSLRTDYSPLYILTAKADTDDPWSYYNLDGSLDDLRLFGRGISDAEVAAIFAGR